ncbi:MAG: hypothetical protein HC900_00865 [Methylacidiphilales bacterium]|nr:hypothetical protein [Candidatus Methylacidiphilales bacterium]
MQVRELAADLAALAPRLPAAEPEMTPRHRRGLDARARENARRLQAVLYELQECRRILDAALSAGRKE